MEDDYSEADYEEAYGLQEDEAKEIYYIDGVEVSEEEFYEEMFKRDKALNDERDMRESEMRDEYFRQQEMD